MRYEQNRKAQTRQRIVTEAGRLFRARGIVNTGIDAVMAAVGLTPGGFYAHFASKQALVTEVLRQTLSEGRERFAARDLVRRYLSRAHRDQPETGCPLPSLLSELPRFPETQEVLAEELEEALKLLPGERDEALRLLARLVGAIGLARALGPSPLSDELLKACRE